MILNGGDIAKINPEVVAKVEAVERLEDRTATVTLQTINGNIFLCNVVFAKPSNTFVVFNSLNLYQKDNAEYVFNMQDGKVYGFDFGNLRTGEITPATPEEFASEVLTELFVVGWG